MSVWWLYILVGQVVSLACGFNHTATKASANIAGVNSSISLDETLAAYNYLPCSHRITDQGLSYESIPMNTFFKKKDLKNYNLFQVYPISKLFINITYVLPLNPMVCNHWICRIQV